MILHFLRKLAKLDKKDDDRITAYFEEFTAMCRRVTGKSTPEDLETKKGIYLAAYLSLIYLYMFFGNPWHAILTVM